MVARTSLVALLGLSLGLGVAGCRKRGDGGDMPLCLIEVAANTATESEAQELPPDIWFSIMLQRFDREQMLPPEDARDCAGGDVITPTLPPLAEGEEPAAGDGPLIVAGCEIAPDPGVGRLPNRPLTEDDLVMDEAMDGMSLVWVKSSHYEDGTAAGPVALIEWTKKGIAVRGLGSLRAHERKARMRIEQSGETRLLVVESDRCDAEGKICQRMMKLLPLLASRFASVPLKSEDGTCLGPAEFALFEQHTSILPDGWNRKFEINRSVTFSEDVPLIAEVVTIRDQDPAQPDAPPQEFRDASTDRKLSYAARYFETRRSLWDEMITNYGSVAHDAKPAEDDE
ncbi:hypothetical protein ACNOYE_01435 [Nannocystaceae bacterium ST9]